jgi:serine phosphatase RsbU (regulator of sigma subunit)
MLMILCTGSFSQQLEYKIMTRQDSAQIIHFSNDYKTADSKGNTAEAAENLNQIAQIYWNNNQDLNAVEYYQKSLKLNEKLGNENGISGINNNLGLLYSDLGKYQEALNCFQKTLVYRKTVRGKGEALSSIYLNISQVYIKLKDYPNAAKQLEESLNYAREEGNQERMQSCYGSLAEIYEKAGDQAKADANFKLYKDYNDMLSRKAEDKFNEANFRATQAENEKLKKENELLNKENELRKKNIELANSTYKNKTLFENLTDAEKKAEYYKKDAQVKQLINEKKLENRKKFITIILTAIVFLIVFIFFLLRYNRQKAETNRKLEYQNTEILQQREEIMQQRDNLEDAFGRIAKQNGELTEANKNIEEKNRNITESINYALLIQEAVLTKTETFNAFFSESFILYKPRDIVSGDFYWHCKVEDKIVVAAVDCTGHGVPGAFLSMAGNELLNRIVEVQKITDPGKILSEMDRGVRQILHQDVSDNDDGMDMTLITFDLKKNKMYFAGAVNPIFVVENGDVAVIPGSKHSIGGLVYTKVNKSFETTEIQYTKDSVVYMFSDGFQDQLNPTNGRFSIPAFKNLLYQIHKEPFDRQKELLEEAHIQWKLDSKQTDDILVMGFKTTIE